MVRDKATALVMLAQLLLYQAVISLPPNKPYAYVICRSSFGERGCLIASLYPSELQYSLMIWKFPPKLFPFGCQI